MSRGYRVLCPDFVGRGNNRLQNKAGYGYPQYLSDMSVLIARTGAEQVDSVGTSIRCCRKPIPPCCKSRACAVSRYPESGHAPMFLDDEQINIVRKFLLKD